MHLPQGSASGTSVRTLVGNDPPRASGNLRFGALGSLIPRAAMEGSSSRLDGVQRARLSMWEWAVPSAPTPPPRPSQRYTFPEWSIFYPMTVGLQKRPRNRINQGNGKGPGVSSDVTRHGPRTSGAAKVATEKLFPARPPIWRFSVRPLRIWSMPSSSKASPSLAAARAASSFRLWAPYLGGASATTGSGRETF